MSLWFDENARSDRLQKAELSEKVLESVVVRNEETTQQHFS